MSVQLFNEKYKRDIIGKAITYQIPGMEWKDIAQELDIALWQNLPKFTGKNDANERTFALTVMRNKIIDLAKTATRKKRWANLRCLPLEDNRKIAKGEEIKIEIEDPHWQLKFIQAMQSPVGSIWK